MQFLCIIERCVSFVIHIMQQIHVTNDVLVIHAVLMDFMT